MKVAVGVDGSAGSEHAVVWAAELAAQRKLVVHIVHALHVAEPYYGGGMAGIGAVYDVLREEGTRMIDDAVKTRTGGRRGPGDHHRHAGRATGPDAA